MANGGYGLQKRVILIAFISPITHLVILASGVGITKLNKKMGEEDGGSEEPVNNAWMELLDDSEGLLCLKPWKEVTAVKATKANIAIALREMMRQAWGEYILFCHYFSH